MITIRQIVGCHPKTQSPSQQEGDAQHVYDAERVIGICQKQLGGGAVLFVPISEATEFEIRRALDDRDGVSCPERLVKLSPDDPRNTCNVLTRQAT